MTSNGKDISYPEIAELFAKEVHARQGAIDPNNEYDWLSLTVGWLLAKGHSPEIANDIANFIRYETPYG